MKKIKGTFKNYKWGGFTFIPHLFSMHNSDTPYAEYWLGTHPDGMSTMENDGSELLALLDNILLPFLLKILDVRDMLSIQVHPSREEAERGFDNEEKEGIPRNAPHRVFKDPNHKPELMVALSEFWLLQGFKNDIDLKKTFESTPELGLLQDYYNLHGLQELYFHIMSLPQEGVNEILKPLGARIKPLYESGKLKKDSPDFWAARAYFTFNKKGFCDRGIFSIYLMNLIRLEKGEGIFQSPGVLHAYLEGQNIECMAASDNVLRGGLTIKHIDVHQLINLLDFSRGHSDKIFARTNDNITWSYEVPVDDFVLQRRSAGGIFRADMQTIILNLGDAVHLQNEEGDNLLDRGEAAIVWPGEEMTIRPQDTCDLFVAFSKC